MWFTASLNEEYLAVEDSSKNGGLDAAKDFSARATLLSLIVAVDSEMFEGSKRPVKFLPGICLTSFRIKTGNHRAQNQLVLSLRKQGIVDVRAEAIRVPFHVQPSPG